MSPNRREWMGAVGVGATAGLFGPLLADESKDAPIASLRVLSFNILVGGERFEPLSQTVKVIRESRADVVGLQEIGRSGPKLAEATGLHRAVGPRGEILSRYPIVAQSPAKKGVQLAVPGRGALWVFNEHLPPAPYQPYQLAGIPYGTGNPFIETAGEAIAESIRARGSQLAGLLMDMAEPLRKNEPLALVGDFNEPSHLDWTQRAVEAKLCSHVVAWPTSRCLADAGLVDAYRAVFPNEVERPGHTWTPRPAKRDVMDRIDFVYARGLEPKAAQVVGESRQKADVVVDPYPSDHRAVVAELAWSAD